MAAMIPASMPTVSIFGRDGRLSKLTRLVEVEEPGR